MSRRRPTRRRITPPKEEIGFAQKILTSRGGGAAALLIGGIATLMTTLDFLSSYEDRLDSKLNLVKQELTHVRNDVVTMRAKLDNLPPIQIEKNRDAIKEIEDEKLPAMQKHILEQMSVRTKDRFTASSANELDKRHEQSTRVLEKRLDGLERRLNQHLDRRSK